MVSWIFVCARACVCARMYAPDGKDFKFVLQAMMHAAKDQETLTEGSKVLTKSCEEFQASACDLLRLVSSDERLLKTICSLTDGSDFDLATFARTFDGKKSCVVKTILFMLKTYMKSARVVCSALHFLSRFLKLKTWETCSSDEKKGLKPPNLILKCHGQSIVINAMREDILQKKVASLLLRRNHKHFAHTDVRLDA